MRRALMVGAGLAALLAAQPKANAQAVVVCPLCAQEIPEAINRAAIVANWITQLERMKLQYDQMVTTYRSITEARTVSDVGRALYALRDTTSTAAQLQGYAFGHGTSLGAAGFMGMNRYKAPVGDDFEAQEINRRQQAVANMQAEAQRGMEAAEERRDSLEEFVDRINGTPDLKDAAGIQARLQQETVELQNQHTKLQQLAMLSQTEDKVDALRAQEAGRAAAADWRENTESAWSGW